MSISATQLFAALDSQTRSRLFAHSNGKSVFLPEGSDPRIQEAAAFLISELGMKVVLGSEKDALRHAPQTLLLMEKKAHAKGKELSAALRSLASDVFFDAGRALEQGEVAAVVGGASVPTAHVIRAALATVGLSEQSKIVTSGFLMGLKSPTAGGQSLLLYADGAVMPRPTSSQLSDIGYLAANAFLNWTGITPHVAFLSFSTAGSAVHEEVTRVRAACEEFKKTHPEIFAEGEVQFDAAVVPEIALRKNKLSEVKGAANVLVFPDLNAGNIGYKMTQRLAGAEAWGPVMFGAAKPFSDLSRGATGLDIAHSVLLTLALAQVHPQSKF